MFSIEQLKNQEIPIAGMGIRPDFVFTSRTDDDSDNNIWYSDEIQGLFNEKLKLKNYSKEKVQHLTYIFVVHPQIHSGVYWNERKSYSRTDKILRLEIKFPDYERFCRAEKAEVLQIMAEQTLRGSQLFLSKEKDFDFPKFYADLSELFRKQGWV